jgi:hypothetical protein
VKTPLHPFEGNAYKKTGSKRWRTYVTVTSCIACSSLWHWATPTGSCVCLHMYTALWNVADGKRALCDLYALTVMLWKRTKEDKEIKPILFSETGYTPRMGSCSKMLNFYTLVRGTRIGVPLFLLRGRSICYVIEGPPLWSSGQNSWLQMQRSGVVSRRYQIFWEVVGLERGPLSLVSTTEMLTEWYV